MIQRLFFILMASFMFTELVAQPKYDYSKMNVEELDRGVVAVRQDKDHVVVSWRTLRSDSPQTPFDIFRDGVKINTQPLIHGGTFFVDNIAEGLSAVYEVKGGGKNGRFELKADAPQGYLPIKLNRPEDGRTPEGRPYSYSANDASVGDIDGDGQYEIILKWDPSNSRDNAHDGFTGPTLFDCYRLDGELLWRINMGPNIRSGAHYVPFIVYDLDGDGKAELMVKTADGTIDGQGHVIGFANADYRHGLAEALAHPIDTAVLNQEQRDRERFAEMQREWSMRRNGNDSLQNDRRNFDRERFSWNRPRRPWPGRNNNRPPKEGRIFDGPENITVFNGLTGAAMDTKPYIPPRGNVKDWGDENANRSERYLAALAFLDGVHASAVFCRGYYTRTVIAAWDWDGKSLKERWVFDTNNPQWSSYAGQGNHNLRVADVDGDGCDEITYGSMALDNDGRGLYNTGMGHGDALHLMAFDPDSDKLQVWDCHENKKDGSDFRDAQTGNVIFQVPSGMDVGRAMAADIDPTNRGVEMWSSDSHGVRNMKGEIIWRGEKSENDNTSMSMGGIGLSVNFGIWWDGDLLRELLDHESVSKYNWKNKSVDVLQRFRDCYFNNGTKSNPCLSADILGDWREEVMVRDQKSTELRIYISTLPTEYRINCLMEDIPYRLSVAAENVGYNQPPEPGFYLGPDKTDYLK